MAEGSAGAAGEPGQSVRVDTPAQPLTAAETRRHGLPRWVWAAGLAMVAVILFVCYVRLSGTIPDNSDGSDQALQAWDLLHGNWLLRGWTVGDVSYYTTEIPEYVIVEKIIGLGTNVIHVGAGLTYTLLVLLAGWLAKGRATGRQGVVRALIASGILLAPQLGDGVHLLIQQPDHIGTQVPLLAVFIVLDRGPRRWYIPAVVAVMLTWVIVSDRVGVFTAALPLAAVCGLRALWALARRRSRLAALWFEISLAAAGIVSFGVAELVVAAIKHLGGYTSLPLPSKLTALSALPAHAVLSLEGIGNLYGADFVGLSPGWALATALVHLVGVTLALAGLFLAFMRFFSGDLILPVLATGIVFNLVFYILSTVPATWFDTREITAVLPLGAVLAGRQLAEPLSRARLEPVLAVVLACYAAALGYGAVQPPVTDGEQPVVGWLEAHHLTTGLGTYTESNIITLGSGGRVAVRTVTWLASGAVPRAYESEASWYDARVSYANFVVTNSADGGGVSLIPDRDIVALAGPPARTYHYKTFTIMVWNHNLLADLGHPPSALPGDVP
ncbi:MAG: hypothetical protein ABSB76_29520 [Streptosporangiaceae bacterium]